MKVSAILFSLLLACQVLPVTMRTAAAQADTTGIARADFADQFGPERLRTDYQAAVARLRMLEGKRLAYTYDYVTNVALALTGANTVKTQSTISYAYDEKGRARIASSASGLERIVIADPTKQAVYLVCPERKEILRLKGAALESRSAPKFPDKSGAKTELGEKLIAGVKASGTRSETTIPAGAQGNEKPLVHTSETWYAPDLATIVYMQMSMPELGDFVMHVENLKFGDVPASTFALPEGYAIRDIALHE
ncbi:hypothetical protein NX786_09005 [Telluria mixta]|uniref:DUF4412 domain-containing protein n=1 Tax=Telluria mixta TaxID=34071 RepID=A0ABT2BWF7_9BURK|nr:hypothetical protein [Telluria mixta]MCS0629470.1 hypothetical protein [Telluria mixta]WEM96954.1 hypothetical protein P0M04_04205 [Telluria mixta]